MKTLVFLCLVSIFSVCSYAADEAGLLLIETKQVKTPLQGIPQHQPGFLCFAPPYLQVPQSPGIPGQRCQIKVDGFYIDGQLI